LANLESDVRQGNDSPLDGLLASVALTLMPLKYKTAVLTVEMPSLKSACLLWPAARLPHEHQILAIGDAFR
jgi:hypothetical protein